MNDYIVDQLQRSSFLRRVLQNPLTYTICAPVLMIAGAATTIAAPKMLGPAAFRDFSLIMAFFQLICTFDLGLARLVDRYFTRKGDASNDLAREIIVARLMIGFALAIAATCFGGLIGYPYALAGLAGACFMTAVGPIAFHRASSNVLAFTLTAFMIQLGLGLPRLAGLMADGVLGCIISLLLWYGTVSVVLNFSYLRSVERRFIGTAFRLYAIALPLFAYDTFWSVYLLTSRWFNALITGATDAGLFSFGANLIWIGAGLVGLVAQVHYPRHLAGGSNQRALSLEMFGLLALIVAGVTFVALPLCRYELARVFPMYAAADASTAAMVVSAIPVGLSCWALPLLIATAVNPWFESATLFGGSIVGLIGLMRLGDHYGGITGQAWGCSVSAILLFAPIVFILQRRGLLRPSSATILWCVTVVAIAGCASEWALLFRA